MGAPKGHPKSGGRQKGSLNRVTASTKEALETAFIAIGGVDALVEWGRENQTEFYKCWSKLIPKDIKVEGGEGFVKLVIVTGVPESDKTKLPAANDRTA